jgi:hypothetical protein
MKAAGVPVGCDGYIFDGAHYRRFQNENYFSKQLYQIGYSNVLLFRHFDNHTKYNQLMLRGVISK